MWRENVITAGVYRNQQQWLISASSDGTTWLTMADKNLWASVVPVKNEPVTPDDTQTVLYQYNNDDSHTRVSR